MIGAVKAAIRSLNTPAVAVDNNPPHRFFKIDVTLNNGGTLVQVGEIQLKVGSVSHPAAMTDFNVPAPVIISESTALSGFEGWRAFDDLDSGSWATASVPTGHLIIDLGVGNEITMTTMTMKSRTSSLDRMPKSFSVYGSNEGVFTGEEQLLITETNQGFWTSLQTRTYTVT